MAWLQKGHSTGRRFHSLVYDAHQSLAIPKIFDRRKLWHDACRRSFGIFAGTTWYVPEWDYAHFGGTRFHDAGFQHQQRPAIHSFPAGLYSDGVVSQHIETAQ